MSWILRLVNCPDEKRTIPSARPDRSSAIINGQQSYQIRDRLPRTRTHHEKGSVQGCPPGPSHALVSRTFKDDDVRPRRSVRSKQREHAPASRKWRATIIRIHSVSSTMRPTRRPSPQVSLSAVYAPRCRKPPQHLTRHLTTFDMSRGMCCSLPISSIYHGD